MGLWWYKFNSPYIHCFYIWAEQWEKAVSSLLCVRIDHAQLHVTQSTPPHPTLWLRWPHTLQPHIRDLWDTKFSKALPSFEKLTPSMWNVVLKWQSGLWMSLHSSGCKKDNLRLRFFFYHKKSLPIYINCKIWNKWAIF